tara:strand:- start:202 stop:450 length:249 start_codon:yes stop_codon:yes gene_type:complete
MQDLCSEMSRNSTRFANGDGAFETANYDWEGQEVEEERDLNRNSDIRQINLIGSCDIKPSNETYRGMIEDLKLQKKYSKQSE